MLSIHCLLSSFSHRYRFVHTQKLTMSRRKIGCLEIPHVIDIVEEEFVFTIEDW